MAIIKIYKPIISNGSAVFYGLDGVSFADIDRAVASIPAGDNTIDLRIHCPGGEVAEGWAIVDKLRATGKKIIATVEGQCASMATVILLAASVRRATRHASLLIHYPYYDGLPATEAYRTADLERLAASLRNDEQNMVDFYVERTGADRVELETLMAEDRPINMDQAKALGFIHEIIEPASACATRITRTIFNNQKPISMQTKEKDKSTIAKAIALLATVLGVSAPHAVNYELNTAAGEVLTIDKPDGEAPAVGDAASPDGEHAMPDGTTIVIVDGVISEIIEADGEDPQTGDEELAAALARVAELEAACDVLSKNAKSDSDNRVLNLVAIAGGEAWLAKARSGYQPQARATNIGSPAARAPKKEEPTQSRVQQRLEALRAKHK